MVRALDRRTTRSGAGIERVRCDSTLVQTYQRLNGLKSRSGRVGGLRGTVHERFGFVLEQHVVILAALFTYQHSGIPCRAGSQRQDLACLRLNGHHTAYLTG